MYHREIICIGVLVSVCSGQGPIAGLLKVGDETLDSIKAGLSIDLMIMSSSLSLFHGFTINLRHTTGL
jgi:hypothetical protein